MQCPLKTSSPAATTADAAAEIRTNQGVCTISGPRCGLSTHLWPSPNEIEDPAEAAALEAQLQARRVSRKRWA
eukprot:COSAG02_NODE_25058_length_670_cov_0.632224_1_plen_72_part_01